VDGKGSRKLISLLRTYLFRETKREESSKGRRSRKKTQKNHRGSALEPQKLSTFKQSKTRQGGRRAHGRRNLSIVRKKKKKQSSACPQRDKIRENDVEIHAGIHLARERGKGAREGD